MLKKKSDSIVRNYKFYPSLSLRKRAWYENSLRQITYYAMISSDSLMLTAIFKIGVRMHYIAETVLNNNNPHVRNLPPPLSVSLSLCIFVLCRVLRLYIALSACNELSWECKEVRTFLVEYERIIYKLFARDRRGICPTSYIHSFLKSQTNEWGMRGKGGKKLFIRDNISPDVFVQQTSALSRSFAMQARNYV